MHVHDGAPALLAGHVTAGGKKDRKRALKRLRERREGEKGGKEQSYVMQEMREELVLPTQEPEYV